VLGLLAGAVGETHDREPGQSVLEMRFDLDLASLEPDESMGNGAREHGPTLGGNYARVSDRSAPKVRRSARDEHVLEELPRATAGAAVDVTA
jgi:hypothetical protein